MKQPSWWEIIGQPLPENSVEAWLASKDPAKHALADEVLAKLGPDDAFKLLASFALAEEKWRRKRGPRNVALGIVTVVLGGHIIAAALQGHGHHVGTGSICGMTGSMSGQMANGGFASRLHRNSIERLAKLKDRRAFPFLVDALIVSRRFDANLVALSVSEMLPELDASDFAVLSKVQLKNLFQFINSESALSKNLAPETSQTFARALLTACARLGRTDALDVTKKTAQRVAKSPHWEPVRETAQDCLPRLERAKAEENAASSRLVLRR